MSQAVKIRLRKHFSRFTEYKLAGITPDELRAWGRSELFIALYEAYEGPQPGDTWACHWHSETGDGPLAGYAICCPKCLKVHHWLTALNCPKVPGSEYCAHYGVGSCWTWTGSAEAGTLTARPSLYASRACGWHGWLTNGEMRPC